MDYKINKINTDGSVNVTFTSTTVTIPTDRATQNIPGIASKDQLDDYAVAFLNGLKQEEAAKAAPSSPDSDLTAIVGKKQTVTEAGA